MPLPPPTVVPWNSLQTPARIKVSQYVRNGLIPNATFETALAQSTNFALAARRKELFRGLGSIADIPTGDAVQRVRWRFSAHTGPMLDRIRCGFYLARMDTGDPIFSPKASLVITNANESVTYGTASVQFGAAVASQTVDVPNEFGFADVELSDVPSGTTVYGKLIEEDQARIISATVYEVAEPRISGSDYVLPVAMNAGGNILDDRRQTLYQDARAMWRDGAAQLFNWSDVLNPTTNATGTPKNIVDGSTGGTSGPCFQLDTQRYVTRGRPNTVPCVFACYASITSISGPEAGGVALTGANTGSIDALTITSSTPQWYTMTVNLEATVDDYYIEVWNTDGTPTETVSVYAVSLFPVG